MFGLLSCCVFSFVFRLMDLCFFVVVFFVVAGSGKVLLLMCCVLLLFGGLFVVRCVFCLLF